MNKTTKIALSLIGLAAVVVPAILLTVLSPKSGSAQKAPGANRSINSGAIEDVVNKAFPQESVVQPTPIIQPTPASSSAQIVPEGSPSAQ